MIFQSLPKSVVSVRGLLREGVEVKKGMKVGDIDPRSKRESALPFQIKPGPLAEECWRPSFIGLINNLQFQIANSKLQIPNPNDKNDSIRNLELRRLGLIVGYLCCTLLSTGLVIWCYSGISKSLLLKNQLISY